MRHGGYTPHLDYQRALMGVASDEWNGLTQHELHQAIPPAYTECVGRQLLEAIA